LAKALRSSGATDESKTEFKEAAALLERQSDAIMSSHLSNESLNRAKSGDLLDAMQTARKAVDLDPDNAIALYNLGLLLADSGDLETASRQLRKAISLAPLQVQFYVSLARMQEMMKRRSDAIISLSHAVGLNPTDPNLELKLRELKTTSPSTADKTISADDVPFQYGARSDSADDHFAFATELSKEGDLSGAVGELLRALTLRPARSDIRYNLAVAYIGLGRYSDAELELWKVLRGTPNSVEAHIALGTVLLQEKEKDHAAEEFRRALSLEPANREAAQLLRVCQD